MSERRVAVMGLAAVAAWGHVGYPLMIALRGMRLPRPAPPVPKNWPPLSVVIPCYREAAVIEAKVRDVTGNGYPGDLEVIVVAEDRATADAARATKATVVENKRRLGKAASVNRGMALVRHERVVLTDADVVLRPGTLAMLTRWFDDPSVGSVAGEKVVRGVRGDAYYWRFEGWLKRMEWRTGTTIGMSGGLVATRRSTWRPLPRNVIADDFWIAVNTIVAGQRVAYDPSAMWSDETHAQDLPLSADWERRTRVVEGTLELARRRFRLLLPGSPVAAQLWGHRVARSSIGPLAHSFLLLWSLRQALHSRAAQIFVTTHCLAALTLIRKWSGRSVSPVADLFGHVLYLQLVALGGLIRYLRGRTGGLYPKDDRKPRHSIA